MTCRKMQVGLVFLIGGKQARIIALGKHYGMLLHDLVLKAYGKGHSLVLVFLVPLNRF